MKILAIDPGPEKSGWVLYDARNRKPLDWGHDENHDLLDTLDIYDADVLAVEMIASYGMAVGKSTFETCVWIGRFEERWLRRDYFPPRPQPLRVFRLDAKAHLCHSAKAKDANVRQALIDKFGEKGTKANPGPLYGFAGHCWAALAVAVTAAEAGKKQ